MLFSISLHPSKVAKMTKIAEVPAKVIADIDFIRFGNKLTLSLWKEYSLCLSSKLI